MQIEYTTVLPTDKFMQECREKYPPELAEKIIRQSTHYRTTELLSTKEFCCEETRNCYNYGMMEFCADVVAAQKAPKLFLHLADGLESLDADDVSTKAISFCPFCGSRFDYVETRRCRAVLKTTEEVVVRHTYEEVTEEVEHS